jgi:methyl-accepting chemotaxis protein
VSDDVREHAARGAEGARDLSNALGECVAELAQIASQIDRARESSTDATQDAARAAGVSSEGERALAEMADQMKKATGSDPETARAISEASEHARALVFALSQVSGKVPRGLVVGALRPVLEPLARLLETEEGQDGDEASE